MTRTAIPKKSDIETREPNKLVHNNLCGPMRIHSIYSNTYIVTYLDDEIGWIHLDFLNKKSQQLKKFKAYQVTFKRQCGINIRCLRTDGGGEYASKEVHEYLKEQGIK